MMDGNDLGLIARVFGGLIKVVMKLFKIAIFFGLGWFMLPIACGLFVEIVTKKPYSDNAVIYFVIDKVMWYSAYPLAVLTLTQNVIRMVKKDRSFSWIGVIRQQKAKGIEAKVDGNVISLVPSTNLKGVVFGKLSGKYAVMPETTDGHILVVGGAGSGKTASIAIPTLMSWKERVFAIDIKGELYQKTGKSRGFGNIKVFNPTDEGALGYDPFYMLRTSTDVSSEARQIAMSICPLPPDTKDPFWIKSAQNLLTGLIMYFFDLGYNFSETMFAIKAEPVRKQIDTIMVDERPNAKKVKAHVSEFSGMDDKTLSGVFAEVSNHITVFATNDDLQRALNGKGACITPADLENGKDIYCCIPEHKLDEWKDLLGMMCNQFLKAFERREEGNKTPILFLIDEFPRLGKIEAISNGLATLRSKKIHIALIVQSKSQLNAIYGKDIAEVIADNCSYKAILKASEPNTQEWCSKLVGTYDKRKVSSNYNADVMGIGNGQGTSTGTEEKRIIKPEEFAYLQDVVCVFPNGYKRLEKANYYEDKVLLNRQ